MHWTAAALRAEIVKIIGDHRTGGADPEDAPAIEDSTHLIADLGIDSMATMEVIADLEDALAMTIPLAALRGIETVGDVVRALESRLDAAGRLGR